MHIAKVICDFFTIFFANLILIVFLQTQIRGTLAQSVEQRTENPCVPGSIPGGTTLKSI